MMERRDFIRVCTVLVGSTVLPIGCGQSGGGSENSENTVEEFSLPDLSRSRWMEIVDTTFSVTHETYGVIDMTMRSIEDEIYDPVTDQFSVVLAGPELPFFEEDVYQVYNSTFGYIELYLQPSDGAAGEHSYRTHFSILNS